MCTVTYIPLKNKGFLLTSNRDEHQSRATASITSAVIGKETVWYPIDPVSGGSWIAASGSKRTACILNGAFEKHHRNLPYKRSRGLVLLDYFNFADFSQFVLQYQFDRIEPFTMVTCEYGRLFEFRWDGQDQYRKELSPDIPYIWSSSTLYDEKSRDRREEWFNDWLHTTDDYRMEDLFRFHRFGGEKDLFNGLVMNRDDMVQTLSITGIEKDLSSALIHHYDLIKDNITQHLIDFSSNEIVESN